LIKNSDSGRELVLKADNSLNLIDSLKEPEIFEDTYYYPNFEERITWKQMISQEFNEMKEKGVYEKICKSELSNVTKISGYLKLNTMDFFVHSRPVACEYSQVPGVNLQATFAPVINDVSFCILLILMILMILMLTWNFKGKIVDIETAILHGNLKEQSKYGYPKEWRQMRMNF
jgi:hypothetical protein